MRALICFVSLLYLLTGCSRQNPSREIVLQVNDYQLTYGELTDAFNNSVWGRDMAPEVRQRFVETLINQQLVIQDAQKKNLDKRPEFLTLLQKFWEQSLLTVAINNKAREISSSTFVSDDSVAKAYEKIAAEGKVNKPYDQVVQQIKEDLIKLKEAKALEDWLLQLRSGAKIEVSQGLLEKFKQGEVR